MARSITGTEIHRERLFYGICLALIPTGASFALVSNILIQLKQEFILTNYQVGLIGGAALWGMAISLLVLGPALEGFGLKNGTRMAFVGQLVGITLMISAVTQVGNPSAFWLLMLGAALMAVGNGMIEVAGNPLVAALYPEEKTTRLNYFHAFFPIGIVAGAITGFLMATYGGGIGRWPFQLAIIYVPILAYGYMVLPQSFPRTENAEAGLPIGEMFRFTLTSPLFLLILVCMGIAISLELGPMRWIPSVMQSAGMHGILVLVLTSGWMVVLRLLAHHFVDRLSPTGMLLVSAVLMGVGLFMLSFVTGLFAVLAAATLFAWGVSFNFPTIVGLVSERLPKTGSLGIVLTAGIGLGSAGAIGVPLMGKIADNYLAQALPAAESLAVLEQVNDRFPGHIAHVEQVGPVAAGYRAADVQVALDATRRALDEQARTGSVQNDATANALRAISAAPLADEPLVGEAAAIVTPAELAGGQRSFRNIAPAVLVLILVWGAMYINDRRRGGYRIERLQQQRKATTAGH
jgi:fucose permease